MSGEGEHPLSGKQNLCKSRKANSTPRLAWRHGIGIPPVACGRCAGGGGKRAAPVKLPPPLSSAGSKEKPCGCYSTEFCQAVFPKAFFALAYGQFRALLSSQRSVSYKVCAFACSLQNPKFPHNPVQKRSRRDNGVPRFLATRRAGRITV